MSIHHSFAVSRDPKDDRTRILLLEIIQNLFPKEKILIRRAGNMKDKEKPISKT